MGRLIRSVGTGCTGRERDSLFSEHGVAYKPVVVDPKGKAANQLLSTDCESPQRPVRKRCECEHGGHFYKRVTDFSTFSSGFFSGFLHG